VCIANLEKRERLQERKTGTKMADPFFIIGGGQERWKRNSQTCAMRDSRLRISGRVLFEYKHKSHRKGVRSTGIVMKTASWEKVIRGRTGYHR